jgi:hypothetical protein
MRHTLRKLRYASIVALALAMVAGSALAFQAPTTTTFYLDNPGSYTVLAGVYTSPYGGQVNFPTSSIVPVICDDFADESFTPEEWTAYVTSLSSLTSGTDTYLKWSKSTYDPSLSQTQAYDVAALLSIDILQSSSGSTAQQDLSYALWALFDPLGNGASPSDPGAFGQLNNYGDTSAISQATTDLNAAINDVVNTNSSALAELSNYKVTIYSYKSGATCPDQTGGVCANTPPQEFITVTTPEASTPILLAVDLLGFIALVGFLRKRVSRSI